MLNRTAFLQKLIAIKDEINQQISLAANRYEEFECAPVEENERDIEIQYFFHEEFVTTAMMEHVIYEHLNEQFATFLKEKNIASPPAIDAAQLTVLKQALRKESSIIYAKIVRTRKYFKHGGDVPITQLENYLTQHIDQLIDMLCQGETLAIDDMNVAQRLRTKLSEDANQLADKMYSGQVLSPDEMTLANRFRRNLTDHDETIDQLFIGLYKKNLSEVDHSLIDQFKQDAVYNIDQLVKKIGSRRYNQAYRLKKNEELTGFREIQFKQFLINNQLFLTDVLDKKQKEKMIKAEYLWRGVFFDRLRTDTGYCDEHTCIALKRILDKRLHSFKTTIIEKVGISYLDDDGNPDDGHTFLVFDRDPNSQLNDMSSWGKNAILFDPWNKLVCFTSELASLPIRYFSYPEGAIWSAIKFDAYDTAILDNLVDIDSYFHVTEKVSFESRVPLLMEEYHLTSLAQPGFEHTKTLLYRLLDELKPDHFPFQVEIFITTSGDQLVRTISGFQEPKIAIHKTFLEKLHTGECSIDELKFALTEALFQIKHCGVGLDDVISADMQHYLDKLAVKKCQNGPAAVSYFRKSIAFAKENKQNNDKNDMPTIIKHYNIVPSSYPQRIKNMLTALAQDEQKRKSLQAKEIDTKEMMAEISNIKQVVFFQEELSQYKNKLEKIRYLISCLPELKIELLPYELTRQPSTRVRDFCRLLQEIEIDLTDAEQVHAADELVNTAHQLRVPGFDRIYLTLTHSLIMHEYDDIQIMATSSMPDVVKPNLYYLILAKQKDWQLFYVTEDEQQIQLDIDKINGLRKAIAALPSKCPEEFKYESLETIVNLLKLNQMVIPLGFFKDYQKAIDGFVNATDFNEAKNVANKINTMRETYQNHFILYSLTDHGRMYRYQYKQSHHDALPTGADRYFGSKIGSRILWHTFNPGHVHDPLPWEKHIEWAKQDNNKLIAKTLWMLGVMRDTRLWSHFTPEELLNFFNRDDNSHITFTLSGRLAFYGKSDTLEIEILSYLSNEHVLRTDMFANTSMTFEQAFQHYFDVNWPALMLPGYDRGFNVDNEAVCYLLEKFALVASKGTPEEKDVVKSFFLGRQDNRDLAHLLRWKGSYPSILKNDTRYARFVIEQQYGQVKFDLFNSDDIIRLINNSTLDMHMPSEQYIKIFKLPFETLTLDCLKQLVSLIIKNDIKCVAGSMIVAHLHQHLPYRLLSQEAITILKLTFESVESFVGDDVRQILNAFMWPDQQSPVDLSHIEPQDLVFIYRMYDYYLSFPSFAMQQYFGKLIIEKIQSNPDINVRIVALEEMLFVSTNRFSFPISDVDLKTKVVNLWVKDIACKYGQDDGSKKYHDTLVKVIDSVYKNTAKRDVVFVFRQLANAIEAQGTVSEHIGEFIEPEKYLNITKESTARDMALSSLAAVSQYFSKNKQDQIKFLDFLSAPIDKDSIHLFAEYLIEHDKINDIGRLFFGNREFSYIAKGKKLEITESMIKTFYYQFWDCSLEQRAVIIDYLFIPSDKVVSSDEAKKAYEESFLYVINKLFPKARDEHSDDHFAFYFLKAYLDTADPYIRPYLLAAMLVVTNETHEKGKQPSVGKKLALLCEHMGPAYVKLAQAIHSHPLTPENIRHDLDHIKGRANPPTRWHLWRLVNEVLPKEDRENVARVGCLLGSASYNLALEVKLKDGRDVVLLMLRENAEKDAQAGFAHLKATMTICQHKKMDLVRETALSMLTEASKLSKLEMDKALSDQQSRIAAKLYHKQFTVKIENTSFVVNLYPSQIIKSGQGYRFIDRVYGTEYNQLPDHSVFARTLRKAVAKIVMTIELINILRGSHFDSDRHGNQLRVYVHDQLQQPHVHLSVGLYDFGEMSLEKPSETELRQFVEVIHEIPKAMSSHISFDSLFSKHINQALQAGQPTSYLMRIRKAFLALQDFQKNLSTKEFVEIMKQTASSDELHPLLKDEFKSCVNKLNYLYKLYQVQQAVKDTLNIFNRTSLPTSRQHNTHHHSSSTYTTHL